VKVALGLKAHSGWAALVVVGARGADLEIVDRRRLDLIEPADSPWAKAPYHAAEDLGAAEGRALVKRGIDAARRGAVRAMRAVVASARDAHHDIAACAVLVGTPMPDWSVDEIRAVHFRMHKAEGVLFRDVLVRAATACDLRAVEINEKRLLEDAERALKTPRSALAKRLAAAGKSIGPPWGKDQKDAALAAWVALRGV
jgi:hypothetical protein